MSNIDMLTETLNKKVSEKVTEKVRKDNKEVNVSLNSLLGTEKVKERINTLLGDKTEHFISTILAVVRGNTELQECDPNSILGSAIISATLDLPIDNNLGFAYLVPFNLKVNGRYTKVAKFMLGYKGYIQLAIRSGAYKTISTSEVYEGEIKTFNRFTGDISFGNRVSDKVIGYMAYYKLLNGFEKYIYMSKEDVINHASKYSKTYGKDNSIWTKEFNKMACKTVLRQLLSKYGMLSIQMQGAFNSDGMVNFEDENGRIEVIQKELIDEIVTEDGEVIPMILEEKPKKKREQKNKS